MSIHANAWRLLTTFANRLLSENGIPKLRTRARDLKIKGKGHEVRAVTHRKYRLAD